MLTHPNWIAVSGPGRLSVAARPRGGDWLDDEIVGWRRAGADVVVSLLTSDEIAEFDLADEPQACRRHGVRFESFAVADRGVPASREAFAGLAGRLAANLTGGQTVVVHCRQGIGRAGMLAVGILIVLGSDADSAVQRVSAARGRSVPETPEQVRWLAEFAAPPVPQPVR